MSIPKKRKAAKEASHTKIFGKSILKVSKWHIPNALRKRR